MAACTTLASAPPDPDPVAAPPAPHEPQVARPVDEGPATVRARPSGRTDLLAGGLVRLDIHGAGPYDRACETALDPPVSATS